MNEGQKEFNKKRYEAWTEHLNKSGARMFLVLGAKENGEIVIAGDDTMSSLNVAQILEETAKTIRKNNKHVN